MCPRGTAFLVLDEALGERMTPHQAGWFAANDPLTDQFGPPLRLPDTARRFDTSPAWFSWVGTEPALELLNEIGVEADPRARPASSRTASAPGLGLEPGDSAIVTSDVPDATEKLARAGIMAAARAGRLRASFHLYNTEADVDAALDGAVYYLDARDFDDDEVAVVRQVRVAAGGAEVRVVDERELVAGRAGARPRRSGRGT